MKYFTENNIRVTANQNIKNSIRRLRQGPTVTLTMNYDLQSYLCTII